MTASDICVTHVLLMSGNGCASISALYVSSYELPLKPTTMRNQILEAFRLFCKSVLYVTTGFVISACLFICPNRTARLRIFVTFLLGAFSKIYRHIQFLLKWGKIGHFVRLSAFIYNFFPDISCNSNRSCSVCCMS